MLSILPASSLFSENKCRLSKGRGPPFSPHTMRSTRTHMRTPTFTHMHKRGEEKKEGGDEEQVEVGIRKENMTFLPQGLKYLLVSICWTKLPLRNSYMADQINS